MGTARLDALAAAVKEVELHVATGGWDAPTRIFALVRAGSALQDNPGLAAALGPGVVAAAQNPEHLLSVEQEDLPPAANIEELLAQLAWPDTIDGAVVATERTMVPASAELDLPAGEQAQLQYLNTHPDRTDVRIVAAVLRSGEAWSALRLRSHDDADSVLHGADLVPGLTAALATTFAPVAG